MRCKKKSPYCIRKEKKEKMREQRSLLTNKSKQPDIKQLNGYFEDQRQKQLIHKEKERKRYKEWLAKNDNYEKKKSKDKTKIKRSKRDALHIFKEHCKEYPEFICCICNRLLFRKQVLSWKCERYSTVKSRKFAKQFQTITDEKQYICRTCDLYVKKGNIPPQAVVNTLQLTEIPNELKCLNVLERHLISPVIPFMKIVPLPKSMQKGVHGPVVCVQSDLAKVVAALPRRVDEETLVKVKLKRKLGYKGHHLYQYVNPSKVKSALETLTKINSFYEGIEIDNAKLDVNSDETGMLSEDAEIMASYDEIKESNISENSVEDILEVSDTTAPLYTCLQPVDLAQYLSDKNTDDIINIAPAEGNKPTEVIKTEAQSFPVQFPDGKNTFIEERMTKLTLKKYFNARLFCVDSRFSSDPEYIFFSQYVSELNDIMSSISIAIRKCTQGSNITSGMIQNTRALGKMIKCDQGYKFLRTVRGSPPYWERTTKNLCAMLRQRGLPTFFITFSAADRRWPEIISSILRNEGKVTEENLDWTQYCKIINSNIVTATRMFDKRLHDFISDIIMSSTQPIGEVDDIFGRIEFQARGWPHYHGLVWIKNAPIFNEASDEEVSNFIDKYISCALPEETDEELHEIVTSVQMHSKTHSKSCKKGGKDCRFNFPRPPSTRTFISRPSSELDKDSTEVESTDMDVTKAKDILQSYWEVINSLENDNPSCQDVLSLIGISQGELEMAMNCLTQKQSVVLKRNPNECWINAYNPALLRAWNGNMDIQFVLDAYSCLMYILSYITKAERELGQLIKEAQKEAREHNTDAVKELRQLGHVYVTHREVSVMESVYRVSGLKLQHCSRDVVWIPSDPESIRITLPLHVLQKKNPESEDIYMKSIIDTYLSRPLSLIFSDICLAQFASEYKFSKTELKLKNCKSIFRLQENMGYIIKRQGKPAIIRYPRFNQKKDTERYYSNILRLFLPHRTKELKPVSFQTLEIYFNEGTIKLSEGEVRVKEVVLKNMSHFEKLSEELDSAWENMDKLGNLEDAWGQVAPNTENQRANDEEELEKDNFEDSEIDYEVPELSGITKEHKVSKGFAVEKSPEEINMMSEKLQSMNKKQQEIFKHIRKWCLKKINGCNPSAFYIYLCGGAGTGKSHVIKCIHFEATKILRHLCEEPDIPTVLLMSFTGTAAFNIGGKTIHSSLKINTLKLPYQYLSENDLNTLKAELKNLQMIIIDEISMVSKPMLEYIDGRLRQVKGLNLPFGNISILAVGDFYQVPPVFGKELFYVDEGKLPTDNWLLFQLYNLTEVMRQRDDKEFADLLNRLRIKSKKGDIDVNDDMILRSRVVPYLTGYPEESIHIYAKNKSCMKHNMIMLNKIQAETIVLQAVDFIVGKNNAMYKRKSPAPCTSCYLPEQLSIKVGARVMLIKNIDVNDGLVNGAMGTVSFIYNGAKKFDLPEQVYVVFDNEKVGREARVLLRCNLKEIPENAVPIEPVSFIFKYGKNSEITRYQFPLVLSWGCTIHKVQGQTFQRVVVSMDGIFNHGMAYVALSRATSLDGLYLLDYKPELIYANSDVEKTLGTMPKLDVSDTNPMIFLEKTSSIKIVHHNIQYLTAHFSDLKNNYEMKEADVICLSETWLKPHHKIADFQLEGFVMHHSDVSVSRTVGLAIYVKNSLKYHIIQTDFNVKGLETLVFLIEVDTNTKVLVSLLYKHNEIPAAIYKGYPQYLLSIANNLNAESVIVLGDFNDNYLCSTCASKSEFEKFEFYQVIESATTTLGTLLDHIYIHNMKRHYKYGVLNTYYSYHDPVFISLFENDEYDQQQLITERLNTPKRIDAQVATQVPPVALGLGLGQVNTYSVLPISTTKVILKKRNNSLDESEKKKIEPLQKKKCELKKQSHPHPTQIKNVIGFEKDAYTPEFPLPNSNLSKSLQCIGTGSHVRIIDYWGGNSIVFNLCEWLRAVGFNVIQDIFPNVQQGPSCGYIATNIAWLLHLSSNWKIEDTTSALSQTVIQQYNEWLNTPSLNARYLTDEEILKVITLHHVQNEGTSSRMNWVNGPMPINFFVKGVRTDIQQYKRNTRKASRQKSDLRICIINTTPVYDVIENLSQGTVSGDHWIVVAYNIQNP